VRAAHSDIRPATLSWSEGELLEANINRSPTAYQANPPEERQRYKHDVDKDMTVLRVQAVEPSGSGTTARCAGVSVFEGRG
jgi:neutral ceramidase